MVHNPAYRLLSHPQFFTLLNSNQVSFFLKKNTYVLRLISRRESVPYHERCSALKEICCYVFNQVWLLTFVYSCKYFFEKS